MKRIVIMGAGESGAGAAVLAKAKGFDVFVSDMSAIKDKIARRGGRDALQRRGQAPARGLLVRGEPPAPGHPHGHPGRLGPQGENHRPGEAGGPGGRRHRGAAGAGLRAVRRRASPAGEGDVHTEEPSREGPRTDR